MAAHPTRGALPPPDKQVQHLVDMVAREYVVTILSSAPEFTTEGVNVAEWYRDARRKVEFSLMQYLVYTEKKNPPATQKARASLLEAWWNVCNTVMNLAIPEFRPM